jgi:hypothetical protein
MKILQLYSIAHGRNNLWNKLILKDVRLGWRDDNQDTAITELCEKYNCKFMILNGDGYILNYTVNGSGCRDYRGQDYALDRIELHFENDNDAIIFKLKYG